MGTNQDWPESLQQRTLVVTTLQRHKGTKGKRDKVKKPQRQCTGDCKQHKGEVRCYYVSSQYMNWGAFWYCLSAATDDQAKGLDVTVAQDGICYPQRGARLPAAFTKG